MNIRIGQKVVCVKPTEELTKNKIYVISEVFDFRPYAGVGVNVVGVVIKGNYICFAINRFAPIITKEELSETTYEEIMEGIDIHKPIEFLN